MNKMTLYLPEELLQQLRDVARKEGRTQADVVREALALYLRQGPHPAPNSIGIGEDPELTAEECKAWLRAQWAQR